MGKEQEELDSLQVKIKELEESLAKEEGNRKELEVQVAKLVEEKNAVSLTSMKIMFILKRIFRFS